MGHINGIMCTIGPPKARYAVGAALAAMVRDVYSTFGLGSLLTTSGKDIATGKSRPRPLLRGIQKNLASFKKLGYGRVMRNVNASNNNNRLTTFRAGD